MRKLILASAAIVLVFSNSLFFTSCNNEPERDPVKDSLMMVNQGLSDDVSDKATQIESFLASFNEIQENLDSIKAKEKLITVEAQSGDVKSKEGQIVADIQAIYDLMNRNKEKLASLQGKLKKSNAKVTELQKMIERLTIQMGEKDVEIASLHDKLEKLNLELSNLQIEHQVAVEESTQKTEKLNTAYYAYGTSKELIANGVLTKEGGFIGIGKSKKLKEDFNKSYFTKIDVSKTSEIALNGAKEAKLLTTHPASSYKMEMDGKKFSKLTITNADEFWGASKYLVIVVE